MKLLLVLGLLASGAAYGADAKVAKDNFDGATRVWVDPHGLDCGMAMVCPMLGARWTSNEPADAVLEVEVLNAYAAIEGAKLNVDGEFIDLVPLDAEAMTKFKSNVGIAGGAPVTRRSTRDYLVPLSLVQKLVAAGDVKLRVLTADGAVDGTLSGGKKPSKAQGALQRFIAKVPAARS